MPRSKKATFRFSRDTRRSLESILERGVQNAGQDAEIAKLVVDLEEVVGRCLDPSPTDVSDTTRSPTTEARADIRKIVAALTALVRAVDEALPETRTRLEHSAANTYAGRLGLFPHNNPWLWLSVLHDDARDITPAVQYVGEPWRPKRGRGRLPHPGHGLSCDVAFAFVLNNQSVMTSTDGVFGRVVAEVFNVVYGDKAPRDPFPMIKTGSDSVKNMSQTEAIRIRKRAADFMRSHRSGTSVH